MTDQQRTDLTKMSVTTLRFDRSLGFDDQDAITELARRLAERDDRLHTAETLLRAREAEVATLARERDAARAIVERLPKMKDGTPVTPLIDLWHPDRIDKPFVALGVPGPSTNTPVGQDRYVNHRECYATRKAAQRAAGDASGRALGPEAGETT